MTQEQDLLTPRARRLSGEELVREVSRQELASIRAERSAAAPRLSDAVRFGRAVGLGVAEMERMAGCSRQTIYNMLPKDEPEPRRARGESVEPGHLSLEVLGMAVAAEGSVPLIEVSQRLQRPVADVAAASQSLAAAKLVSVDRPRHAGDRHDIVAISATAMGENLLRSRFDDLYLARSGGFAVYLEVEQSEKIDVERALDQLASSYDALVIEATVAPSKMAGPELAMSVNAPTSRMAVRIATDFWDELRKTADLPPRRAAIVDVAPPSSPPSAESAVLDEFVEGAGERSDDRLITATWSARARYAGGADERTLASRCLTAAAWAMRRALGQATSPRRIADSEAAWGEWSIVRGLHLNADLEEIQRPLLEALELALERLGPFRGGELGSFRSADGSPHVVESITPSPHELERMARLAGRAFAAAAKSVPELTAQSELRAIFT